MNHITFASCSFVRANGETRTSVDGDIPLGTEIPGAATHLADVVSVVFLSVILSKMARATAEHTLVLRSAASLIACNILPKHANVDLHGHVTAAVCFSWARYLLHELDTLFHGFERLTFKAFPCCS